MPAYYRASIKDFLETADETVIAQLATAYANDGFVAQYTSATIAWALTLPAFKKELIPLFSEYPDAGTWQLLLEFPLYRLRRRIDAVLLTPSATIVLELKTGATEFLSQDKRQAVEYAQDLRDFHEGSKSQRLHPVLWALQSQEPAEVITSGSAFYGVAPLSLVDSTGLRKSLIALAGTDGFGSSETSEARGRSWDEAPYAPVPSVVDAAITLFSGHSVREISLAGAKNLNEVAETVFSIIQKTKSESSHERPRVSRRLVGLS